MTKGGDWGPTTWANGTTRYKTKLALKKVKHLFVVTQHDPQTFWNLGQNQNEATSSPF
jgi:hypothetical protein